MGDISFSEAVLLSTVIEGIFYGIYIPIFFACAWLMIYRARNKDPSRRINWRLLSPTIILFVLATTHIIVSIRRLVEGFNHSPNPHKYFTDPAQWLSIFTDAIYLAINVTGDSVVIYRCYLVWDRRWKVITLPIIMLLGSIVTWIGALVNSNNSSRTVFSPEIQHYFCASHIISFGMNMMCTLLIIYRLVRAYKCANNIFENNLTGTYFRALTIVIESAALYTITLALTIGIYLGKLNSEYIPYAISAQIIGIVPTLILDRVSLGLTYNNGSQRTSNSVESNAIHDHLRRPSDPGEAHVCEVIAAHSKQTPIWRSERTVADPFAKDVHELV